jgi:predicted DNA-binding transcriptional regulator YafY
MPRDDQISRQWFLLKALEKPGGATIDEFARSLPGEFACHTRTIRRDLQALEGRFPIYTDYVNGQVRWKLVDGFSLVSPLQFSVDELMALAFICDPDKPLEETAIKNSLESALAKIADALPAAAKEYIRNLQGWFAAGTGSFKNYREHREVIDQLSRAIAKKRTVEMRYSNTARDRTSRRKVDPYHIWYASGALYLIGFCHLRKDVRLFAIDRILSLTVTNLPSQIPLGFDAEDFVRNALMVMGSGPQIEVELLFDRKTSAWAKDRIWHPSQKATVDKDGCLRLHLQVADTPELASWILSFGPGVTVLKPESVSRRIKTITEPRFRY